MDVKHQKIFDNPISNIMRKRFSRFKIDREGKNLVAGTMFKIHAILMKNFEEKCESSGTSMLKCVQSAVQKSLPTDLLRLALAEANRKLLLFQRGLIVYDHVSNFKRFAPVSIFKDGIRNLILLPTGAKSVPEFGDSGKKIAEILSSIVDFISTKVANYSSRQNLTEASNEHVMEVVKEIFPKNLFEHAKLRGYSKLRDFDNSMGLESDVKRRAPKRKRSEGKSPSRKRKKTPKKRRQPSVSAEKSVTGRYRKRTVSTRPKSRTRRQRVSPKRGHQPSVSAIKSVTERDRKRTVSTKPKSTTTRQGVLPKRRRPKSGTGRDRKRTASTRPKSTTTRQGVSPKRRRPKSGTGRDRKRTASTRPKSRTGRQGVSPKRRLQSKTIPKSQKPVGRRVKATQRAEKVNELNFLKEISTIFTMISRSPSASIGPEGKDRINNFLAIVLKCLIQECATLKSPVTPETVMSAAENFLPCHIARHAIAHANQKIGTSGS